MTDHLLQACKAFSLVISVRKTVILTEDSAPQAKIMLDNNPLDVIEKPGCAESTMTSTTSLDDEIGLWIGNAATALGRLSKGAWNNKMLTVKIKIQIYRACNTLFYESETWIQYTRHDKKLDFFHLRC